MNRGYALYVLTVRKTGKTVGVWRLKVMPLSSVLKKIRHYINKIEVAVAFAQANDAKDAKETLKSK